ncbi:MAG: sulfite exporter TauE/SafE family protein, partial [Casimicrobiaceae bacterium]
DPMLWLGAYAVTGALVGFLAGLLGIGGGMTLVPVLAAMFVAQQLTPDHTVHLALGTAMASIVFTSSASVREHHRHAAVDWQVVKRMVPGMLLGALISTVATGWIAQRTLALAFATIVFAGATQILIGRKPAAHAAMPGAPVVFGVGTVIGVISGLVSAGGTFLTVPFMLYCGVRMHTAIGTGAAIGIPVALVGSIGYIISGWRVDALPSWSLGFVYLPALALLVAGSIITAPIGARAAHKLPVSTLRRVFACLLFVLATKMVVTYW